MIYLLIEFIDELVFGVGEAAWPLICDDLGLSYFQIGLALSLPGLLANFILRGFSSIVCGLPLLPSKT